LGQPVKLKSLITRINRRLAKTQERLCKSRPNEVQALGEYYLVNGARKAICRCRLEPIAFAAERKILTADDVIERDEPIGFVADESPILCREPRRQKS
jgi:hypothetical protein